jgi:heptosyltransferase-2
MAKILVKGVNWIGDSIFMTPALAALRKGFPNSYISLLISPWVKEVFDGNPNVDEIIAYDERGKQRSLMGKIRFIQSLRNRNFDVGIIMQPRSYRAALFVYLSGIPERIGYNYSLRNLLLTRRIELPETPVHDIDMFLNIVLSLVMAPARKEPYLPFSPKADIWANSFLEERGVNPGELLIGINPGAFKQSKRWPESRYAQLSDTLIREFRAKVIIFQGPGEDEIVGRVLILMKEKAILAKTGIKELAALCRRCKLFVGNDTGPMHVAAASGTPVIALYGPIDPQRSRPWGREHVVIKKDLPCSPCSRRVCKKLTCMKSISIEDVLKAVRVQLGRIEKLDREESPIGEVKKEVEQENSATI